MGDEGAFAALEEAYRIGAPNALDMAFIELGEDMRDFAGAALAGEACGIPRSWLETVQLSSSAYAKKVALAIRFFREEEGSPETVFLSPHERTVLTGLSQGLTRKEIAQKGGFPVGRIKPLIKRVYNKLGAVNRADAIRIASTMGLLQSRKASGTDPNRSC
jgi:LuxR family maltose regulon positive regulatory protein